MKLAALKNKIALGTVQLGVSYGINNKTGVPDRKEAFNILDTAFKNGINLLDSAEAYGDSLEIIGGYIRERDRASQFEIVSKFVSDDIPLKRKIDQTLNTLQAAQLYGYMFHRFADYSSRRFIATLSNLKAEKKIQKIGVSLYSLEELRQVVDDDEIDFIQLPFNVFDSSDEKKSLMIKAKEKGKEIHVRSVYLQGLFFKTPESLTGNLTGLSGPLHQFQARVRDMNVSIMEACLNYALHEKFIDRVIIGVETSNQLLENFSSVRSDFSQNELVALSGIKALDNSLINPSNWKP